MNSEQKILKIMENNNGVITTREIVDMNLARINLTRMVEKGLVERKKHGLYVLPTTWGDEYYSLVYNIKDAIFSHLTALYFHHLCQRVPLTYDITVSKKYRGRLEHDNSVRLYKVGSNKLEIGRINIKSPQGKTIEIYDVERCLCDLIKDKENIDFEDLKYAFVEYFRIQKKDTFKLYKYAKKLGIEKEVNEFMETLL